LYGMVGVGFLRISRSGVYVGSFFSLMVYTSMFYLLESYNNVSCASLVLTNVCFIYESCVLYLLLMCGCCVGYESLLYVGVGFVSSGFCRDAFSGVRVGGGVFVWGFLERFYVSRSIVLGLWALLGGQLSFRGSRSSVAYFSLFSYVFSVLLVLNMVGMVPLVYTCNAQLSVAYLFAGILFVGLQFLFLEWYTFYSVSLFVPAGVSSSSFFGLLLLFLLVNLEFISYMIRWISLFVRLFSNLTSGHVLLKIFSGLLWGFLWVLMSGLGTFFSLMVNGLLHSGIGLILYCTVCSLVIHSGISGIVLKFFGTVCSLVIYLIWMGLMLFCMVFLLVLETFVAFLQAYIFCYLCLIYLSAFVNDL